MRGNDAYEHEVASLRRENATLKAELAYYKEMLTPQDVFYPREWRLTVSEEKIMAALIRVSAEPDAYASKEHLFSVLYSATCDVLPKIVDVMIHHIRQKVTVRHKIEIENVRGKGYRLSDKGRMVVERRLASMHRGLRRFAS